MMLRKTLTKETNNDLVRLAVDVLQDGGIVAYPTETFYGLGVKFDRSESLKRLYELKQRPAEKAMPVIIGRREMLQEIVSPEWFRDDLIVRPAEALMERFWPGPLTLLLPARKDLSECLTADTGKIAVRIPGDSFGLTLVKAAGFVITSTSANLSGMPPADDADRVVQYFDERLDLLIDGGRTPGGAPSTIVDLSEGKVRVLREGAIKSGQILAGN